MVAPSKAKAVKRWRATVTGLTLHNSTSFESATLHWLTHLSRICINVIYSPRLDSRERVIRLFLCRLRFAWKTLKPNSKRF